MQYRVDFAITIVYIRILISIPGTQRKKLRNILNPRVLQAMWGLRLAHGLPYSPLQNSINAMIYEIIESHGHSLLY